MGMQAKAWSSAELKKKTIKDVNEAIESGEIEVSGGGTEVVANPTLAGTEAALTGLQVDDTKYKVPESYWIFTHPTELRNLFVLDSSIKPNKFLAIDYTSSHIELRIVSVSYTSPTAILTYNGSNNQTTLQVDMIKTTAIQAGLSIGSAEQVLGKDANNALSWITPKKLYQHYLVSGDDRFYIITTNSSPMSYDDVVYHCWEYNGTIISIIYHDDMTNHRHVCITDDNGISDGGSGINKVAYIHNGVIVVKALPTSGTDTVTEL